MKATPATPKTTEAAKDGGMMLLVSQSVWDAIRVQAEAENVYPGAVLAKALAAYLKEHGSEESKTFVSALEARRAAG